MKFNNPFKKNMSNENPDTETGPEAGAETGAETPAAEASAEQKLQTRVAALEAQVSDLQHKIILGLADYQNLARRSRISEQQARDGQTRTIAQSLAGVLDHFDQALKVDPATASASDVLAGVSMVHGELIKVLAAFGVDRIDAKPGDTFDANLHQALMKMKVDGVKEGAIAACFQPGYRLGDMVIRAAQVAVAE